MRAEVRQNRACLGSLSADERRLLSLRAGLNGSPESRGQAARDLGISRAEAARLEHSGLRGLRACGASSGGSGGSGSAGGGIASRTASMPQLQPTQLLAATSSPTNLVAQSELSGPHAVKGETSAERMPFTSGPTETGGQSNSLPLAANAASVTAAAGTSASSNPWLIVAGALVLMAGLALITTRTLAHRAEPSTAGSTAQMAAPAAAIPAPAPPVAEKEPEPAPPAEEPEWQWPTPAATPAATATPEAPSQPEPTTAPVVPATSQREWPGADVRKAGPNESSSNIRRAARPAAVVASGVLSFAARELMRRRRRR